VFNLNVLFRHAADAVTKQYETRKHPRSANTRPGLTHGNKVNNPGVKTCTVSSIGKRTTKQSLTFVFCFFLTHAISHRPNAKILIAIKVVARQLPSRVSSRQRTKCTGYVLNNASAAALDRLKARVMSLPSKERYSFFLYTMYIDVLSSSDFVIVACVVLTQC